MRPYDYITNGNYMVVVNYANLGIIDYVDAVSYTHLEVLALQNKELQAYNQTLAVSNKEDLAKGVIAIDGYELTLIHI